MLATSNMTILINKTLVSMIKSQFKLNWNGVHGASHWTRVRNNGLRLAKLTGANTKVIEYFAFLHDSCRESDGSDDNHGRRAAEFGKTLLGQSLHLTELEFRDFEAACIGHSQGYTTDQSVTVMTCWDADRLDLGRVGLHPDPRYLCTDAAKTNEMIRWAYQNSQF